MTRPYSTRVNQEDTCGAWPGLPGMGPCTMPFDHEGSHRSAFSGTGRVRWDVEQEASDV